LPRRLPVAVLAAGAIAAIAMPRHWPAVGLLVGALAVTGAVLVAGRKRLTAWSMCFGALALILVALTAIRAAPWVATVDIVAALALGTLAVSGTAGWLGLLQGLFSPLGALGRAVPWLARSTLRRPAGSGSGSGDETPDGAAGIPRGPRINAPMLRGISIAAVLLIVFGLLFMSADAAFAALAGHALPRLDGLLWGRLLVGLLAAAFAGPAALVALRPVISPTPGVPRERPLVEWALPLAALDLLFAAFVAVQLTVLFGGNAHVLRTSGLTYAQYARQGFWQLLVVAALTLGVVAIAIRLVPRGGPADRLLLRVLLGVLCGLTLVVLASAVRRLNVYEQAYGLTRLRVSVTATLLWLAAVFVLVLVAGAFRHSAWLPRASVAVTGLALVVFALSNPDARIAQAGIDRAAHGKPVDTGYLSGLSADAIPTLAGLADSRLRACALPRPDRRHHADSWADWNLARSRARHVMAGQPARPAGDCFAGNEGSRD